MRRSKFVLILLLGALFLESAQACPVCYGASDSTMLDGLNLSIIFMLVLTYTLVSGFLGFFLFLRWKQRQFVTQQQTGLRGLGSVESGRRSVN
jgi:hypothetical protein